MCCCVHSRKKKKTSSIFPALCHTTFHCALITCCNVSWGVQCLMNHDQGRFPFNKNSGLNFGNFTISMERYISVAQTRPKPPRTWLLFLQAGYKRAVLGTTMLSNGKEHFGLTDRNDQTGQRGPPSKLVPIISVRPNQNGPFHLM